MVILLIFVALVALFLSDISGSMVCGFPKKDSYYLEFLEELKKDNPYLLDGVSEDCMISSVNTTGYISYSISGVLCGCYVDGIGMVPRWYKSYSEINKLRNELKDK